MFTTFPCESSSSERNSFHGGLPSLRNVSPDASMCGYFVNWKAAHDCRWRLARERWHCACTATMTIVSFKPHPTELSFRLTSSSSSSSLSMLFLCISSQFFAINAKAPNLHENLPVVQKMILCTGPFPFFPAHKVRLTHGKDGFIAAITVEWETHFNHCEVYRMNGKGIRFRFVLSGKMRNM